MASRKRRRRSARRQDRGEFGHRAAFVLLVCLLAFAAFAVMMAASGH